MTPWYHIALLESLGLALLHIQLCSCFTQSFYIRPEVLANADNTTNSASLEHNGAHDGWTSDRFGRIDLHLIFVIHCWIQHNRLLGVNDEKVVSLQPNDAWHVHV